MIGPTTTAKIHEQAILKKLQISEKSADARYDLQDLKEITIYQK